MPDDLVDDDLPLVAEQVSTDPRVTKASEDAGPVQGSGVTGRGRRCRRAGQGDRSLLRC